ncbi:hypothetical protein KC343_g18969, partial [Hortaea werneckii]
MAAVASRQSATNSPHLSNKSMTSSPHTRNQPEPSKSEGESKDQLPAIKQPDEN